MAHNTWWLLANENSQIALSNDPVFINYLQVAMLELSKKYVYKYMK